MRQSQHAEIYKKAILSSQYSFQGISPSTWSIHGNRYFLDYLRHLGINQVAFALLSASRSRSSDSLWQYHMYHDGKWRLPESSPCNVYSKDDILTHTEQVQKNIGIYRDAILYARQIGMHVELIWPANMAAPGFCATHPELLAVRSEDYLSEGHFLCPSIPESRQHIMDLLREQLNIYPQFDMYSFYPFDPGGCHCSRCTPYGPIYADLAGKEWKVVLESNDKAIPVLDLWHFSPQEIEAIIRTVKWNPILRVGVNASYYRSGRKDYDPHCSGLLDLIAESIKKNIDIEIMLSADVMEGSFPWPASPVTKLDQVIRSLRRAGVRRFALGGVTHYPLVPSYTISLYLFAALVNDPSESIEEIILHYASRTIGRESAPLFLEWCINIEKFWEKIIACNQEYHFGCRWPGVVVDGDLKRIDLGKIQKDVQEACLYSEKALTAMQDISHEAARYFPSSINEYLIGTRVLMLRSQIMIDQIASLQEWNNGNRLQALRHWNASVTNMKTICDLAGDSPLYVDSLKYYNQLEEYLKDFVTVQRRFMAFGPRTHIDMSLHDEWGNAW
jgi:hypothetical protein